MNPFDVGGPTGLDGIVGRMKGTSLVCITAKVSTNTALIPEPIFIPWKIVM